MAKGQLSGITAKHIPARRDQSPDRRLDQKAEQERMRHQERQYGGGERTAGEPRPAARHRDTARPSSPWGRTSRTSIMTTNAMMLCHSDGMTSTDNASTTAMTTLANSAPATFPRPPRIVIAKAFIVSGKPTVG